MARTKETEMIAWRQMYYEGLARAARQATNTNDNHVSTNCGRTDDMSDNSCIVSSVHRDETSSTLYQARINETDVDEQARQSCEIAAKNIKISSKQTQYYNPFLDIEAMDDDHDEEVSDNEELDQFISRDDEVDGVECSRHVRSPVVMHEHAKSTYLTDVIRHWEFETDGRSTEHGSLEKSPPCGTQDYAASGLAAGPLIGRATSIDESYIWKMKCQRHRGRYIVANILACSEHVPVVQVLVRSAIYVPSDPYCVYLEAHMTKALKTWLKTVPGVVVFNDSVILTAVDYSDWHKVMTHMPKYREPNSFAGDQWRTIGYGTSTGRPVFVIGPSDDIQQPGYDVLMVPMLSVQGGAYDTYPVQSLEPMLFDATTMAIIHGEELLREIVEDTLFDFRGQDYEYGLLRETVPYDCLRPIDCIDDKLLRLFIKSDHPQIIQNIDQAPRPRSWEFYSGEPVTIHRWSDQGSSRLFADGRSRACIVIDVQDTYLEVDDIEGSGQFIVKEWHTIEKIFRVGQFVVGNGVCGFVDAVELNALHLVMLDGGQEREQVVNRSVVHPNSVRFSDACSSHHPPASSLNLSNRPAHDFALNHTSPLVGMCGVVLQRHNPFRGLMVVVKDVRVEKTDSQSSSMATSKYGNEADKSLVLSSGINSPTTIDTIAAHDTDKRVMLLVQRLSYAPGSGGGFSEIWVPYKDVVDVKTHLPLVAVQGLVNEPRFLPPIRANPTTPHHETRSTTPLPTAEEGSLSPAWNPASSLPCGPKRLTPDDAFLSVESGPSTEDFSVSCHWTQDIRMSAIGDLKVRVIVDGRECRGSLIRLGNRMQLRLLRGGPIEPHRILPRHPTPRNQHGSLWVIIQGEHCGVLVRGLRHFCRNHVTWWDVRVTERRRGGKWVYLDRDLVVPSTDLTVVMEPADEKAANQAEAYKMREFSRADYFKKG